MDSEQPSSTVDHTDLNNEIAGALDADEDSDQENNTLMQGNNYLSKNPYDDYTNTATDTSKYDHYDLSTNNNSANNYQSYADQQQPEYYQND